MTVSSSIRDLVKSFKHTASILTIKYTYLKAAKAADQKNATISMKKVPRNA